MMLAEMVLFLGLDVGVLLALMMFAAFVAMILVGYNVAFSFASCALVFAFIGDVAGVFDPAVLHVLPLRWFQAVSDPTLLAVPLFVLMGAVLQLSGSAERLLNAVGILMGSVRGGVAAAVVVVGTLLAATTGVVAATVIVMGLLALPVMLKLGYDHKLACGVIVASGTLAQLLPPSIVLILLSQQMGVGVLELFSGALLPGLMLSGMYVLYALCVSWLNPSIGPAIPVEQRTLEGNPLASTKVLIAVLLAVTAWFASLIMGASVAFVVGGTVFVLALTVLMFTRMLSAVVMVAVVPMFVLIIGVLLSIFQGVATPSESGAVGVFGAIMLALLNRVFDWLLIKDGATHVVPNDRFNLAALRQAGRSTADVVVLVMTLLFSSTFFSVMFFQLGGSDQTARWLSMVGGGKLGFVVVAMIAVFLLGINLEFLEITFIVVPIFVPAMELLGFTADEYIWFTVLMATNLNMAFISPPVGFSLFYLQNVAPPEVRTSDIHKGALPFMAMQCVALVLLALFPDITYLSLDMFS